MRQTLEKCEFNRGPLPNAQPVKNPANTLHLAVNIDVYLVTGHPHGKRRVVLIFQQSLAFGFRTKLIEGFVARKSGDPRDKSPTRRIKPGRVSPDQQKDFVGYFFSCCGVANDAQGDGINDPRVTIVNLFEGWFVEVNESPTVGLMRG
jgi:hypothetical protein